MTTPFLASVLKLSHIETPSQQMIVVTPTTKLPSCWEAIQPLVVASSSIFVRSAFMLQFSFAGAAATIAARSGDGIGSEAASIIAAHQSALQLWLLCSFVCDALAVASQALVADIIGREDAGKDFPTCT
jgi:Na+-driven multidrug efflux pump